MNDVIELLRRWAARQSTRKIVREAGHRPQDGRAVSRVHGTTRRVPHEMFERDEESACLRRRCSTCRRGPGFIPSLTIQVARALYSVPTRSQSCVRKRCGGRRLPTRQPSSRSLARAQLRKGRQQVRKFESRLDIAAAGLRDAQVRARRLTPFRRPPSLISQFDCPWRHPCTAIKPENLPGNSAKDNTSALRNPTTLLRPNA